MRKSRKMMRCVPETDEETYLERQIAAGMVVLALFSVACAVMAVAATFWGWRP